MVNPGFWESKSWSRACWWWFLYGNSIFSEFIPPSSTKKNLLRLAFCIDNTRFLFLYFLHHVFSYINFRTICWSVVPTAWILWRRLWFWFWFQLRSPAHEPRDILLNCKVTNFNNMVQWYFFFLEKIRLLWKFRTFLKFCDTDPDQKIL